MLSKKPNIVADADSFRLLRDDIGIGFIREVSPPDVGLIAPHISSHNETLFVASSGVALNNYPGVFKTGEQQLAVEWVRREPNPEPTEPELNVNRFIFGLTPDGRCHGYDVTEKKPDVSSEQVGNHWSTLDEAVKRYIITEPTIG